MLTTTFALAKKARACARSYHLFAKEKGGIDRYGEDTPIPLTEIAEVIGMNNALWCLRCTREKVKTRRLARLLAADFAEHVLPLWERLFPDDKRPRQAIEAAQLHARGKIRSAARFAAGAAATAAALAVDRSAAGAAAAAVDRSAAKFAALAAAAAADRSTSWDAAFAAAAAAALAVDRSTSWDAAFAAAAVAEQTWQLKRFMEVLSK